MEHFGSDSSVGATLGIKLSLGTLRSVHYSVSSLEDCCVVCKVVDSKLSCESLQDYLKALLSGRFYFKVVNVSHLGKGSFRI